MKKIFLIISILNFCACDIEIAPPASLSGSQNQHNHQSVSVADALRQKDIQEDYLRDNFNFDQFKDVDWANTSTYGNPQANVTLSKSDYKLPENSILKSIGFNDTDYYSVSIRADGSCWMRAALQQVWFVIFTDDSLFNSFIAQIPTIADKYKDVAGFKGRFLHENLINLLKTLKNLSPAERLVQLNKDKIDTFLDYTFRAFLHAHAHINNFKESKESLKKLIKIPEWGDASDGRIIYNEFLPNQNRIEMQSGGDNILITYKNNSRIDNIYSEAFEEGFEENKDALLKMGISKKEDLLSHKFLQVLPVPTNTTSITTAGHYDLIVNKKVAKEFGYEEAITDALRQKDIQEDYAKDNFKLDELRKIDWGNTNDYGSAISMFTLSKTTSTNYIDKAPLFQSLGTKDEDYYQISVKGDGNCWITAGLQTVFYLIFNDDDLFNEVITQLPLLVTEYKDVPGFKDRFLHNELITLLKTLKNLSPQQRLVEFNKEKSYKLLNYSFRALLHAKKFSNYNYNYRDEDTEEELKNLLIDKQWVASRDLINFFDSKLLKNKKLINLFFFSNNKYELVFTINTKESSISADNLDKFFNNTLDEMDKILIKSSLEEFKKVFNINKKEDLLNSPLLQVIPMFVNNNHYNLLVNKKIANKFGYSDNN